LHDTDCGEWLYKPLFSLSLSYTINISALSQNKQQTSSWRLRFSSLKNAKRDTMPWPRNFFGYIMDCLRVGLKNGIFGATLRHVLPQNEALRGPMCAAALLVQNED
jgi:hypothetical protein